MSRNRHNLPQKRRSMRDFHRKRYGNPLFNTRRPQRRPGRRSEGSSVWRRTFILLLAAAGLAILGYGIYGPALRITAVEIDGATPLTEQRIREIVHQRMDRMSLLVLPQSTVLFFDSEGVAKDIEKEFYLEELSVHKRLPGSLTVTVREIPKRAVLFGDQHFLAVSETGDVIRELTEKEVQRMSDLPPDIATVLVSALGAEMVEIDTLDPEAAAPTPRAGNDVPLLFDDEHDDDPYEDAFRPGDTAFAPATVALVLQANARLPDITGSAVRWFNIREKDETVDVTMEGDWHVYLTTAIPFDVQGERLSLILREKVGADRDRLQYVDLRYNERIFFKLRETSQE